MKTVAVMQPYFFPYLGYFQLVASSGVFVTLQDVAFIKRGWINRNRFLVDGRGHLFTIPLRAASSHRTIDATPMAESPDWRPHFLRLLQHAYARAPFRDDTLALVSKVISQSHASIGSLAEESVRAVCDHVGLAVTWRKSREFQNNGGWKGSARIQEICRALNATHYINAPGGKELYDKQDFNRSGIELRFLRPVLPQYEQAGGSFIEGLSIIDVLMFNSPEQTRLWMTSYELE